MSEVYFVPVEAKARRVDRADPLHVVSAAARRIWPKKTSAELAVRTGASIRAAERWLAGEREMGGEALIALLRSDGGPQIYEAIRSAVDQSD